MSDDKNLFLYKKLKNEKWTFIKGKIHGERETEKGKKLMKTGNGDGKY